MKYMPLERRVITENKIIKMIQELGESFKNFLLANSTVDIARILEKANIGLSGAVHNYLIYLIIVF